MHIIFRIQNLQQWTKFISKLKITLKRPASCYTLKRKFLGSRKKECKSKKDGSSVKQQILTCTIFSEQPRITRRHFKILIGTTKNEFFF